MITGILVLISAIALSILAGYISIIGMTALFPGGGIHIIAVMSVLEVSKIFVTMWIHRHWNDKGVNFAHRTYLIFAVLSLMTLTSIGVFGFLSRSHLDQEAPMAGIDIQTEQLQQKIDQIKVARKTIDERKAQLDQSIETVLKNSKKASDAKTAQRIVDSQRADRDHLTTDMSAKDAAINELSEQLAKLKLQSSEVAAKLGPIKYLATTFGISDPNFAVEAVIVLITLVFDPLAILLFLAAIISFEGHKEQDIPAPAIHEKEAETLLEIREIEASPDVLPESEVQEPATEIIPETETDQPLLDWNYDEWPYEPEIETTGPVSLNFEIASPHNIIKPAAAPISEHIGPSSFGFEITKPLAIFDMSVKAATETASIAANSYGHEDAKSVKDQLIELLEHNPGLLQSVIDAVIDDTPSEIIPPEPEPEPEPEPTISTPASQWLSKPWFGK